MFAQVGTVDAALAHRMIDTALAAGVNLIDTADVYSWGLSEELVGAAVRNRRAEVIVATKVRFPMGAAPNDAGLSRRHIIAACEASLRRLGTDYIDLYQAHGWDGTTPLEETLEAFDTLVRSGKVRYIGCSNHSAWHLLKALATSERHSLQRYVSHQVYYSLVAREVEFEIVPAAIDQGLGILVWSPLAGGLLTGKYRRGRSAPAGSRHLTDWKEPPVRDQALAFEIIEEIVAISDDTGATATQVALAYLLERPGVTSLICGVRSLEQLEENLKAADLELSHEHRVRLDELSRPPLPYPHWHQARFAADRLGHADLSLLADHVGAPPRGPEVA
jgi:aryl-alcohol dehydrogenase-like predicted oxidoreductase